jgi:hypothetical protein
MQKVQGQELALEETRNSKVTVFLFFTLFIKSRIKIALFLSIGLFIPSSHIQKQIIALKTANFCSV